MTQVVRRVFLVHATVISATAQTVDLVVQDHSVSDVHRAVVRHLSVLNEEDVTTLGFRPRRQTNKPFIAVVLIENVGIARVPRWNMQVRVWIQLDVELTLQVVAAQHPAVEDTKHIGPPQIRHLKAVWGDHIHLTEVKWRIALDILPNSQNQPRNFRCLASGAVGV